MIRRTEEYDIRYKDNRLERWQHIEVDEGLLPKGLVYDVRLHGRPARSCRNRLFPTDRRGLLTHSHRGDSLRARGLI